MFSSGGLSGGGSRLVERAFKAAGGEESDEKDERAISHGRSIRGRRFFSLQIQRKSPASRVEETGYVEYQGVHAVRPSLMPTVLQVGPYRFFFFAGDRSEPRHIHVRRDSCTAKVWLESRRFAWNRGFSAVEIRRIGAIIIGYESQLKDAWLEFFSA